MKKIFSILAVLLYLSVQSQTLYVPNKPDSLKLGVNVNGVVRSVYVTDLTKNKADVFNTSIAGLRSMVNPTVATTYYTNDPGQEGFWRFNPSGINSDNTGTYLVSSSGKHFERIYNGGINLLWFGVKGDGTNETTKIQSAINAATNGVLVIPGGVFYANKLKGVNNIVIEGLGTLKTHASSIIGDALINFTNNSNITIRNITLDGNVDSVAGSDLSGTAILQVWQSNNITIDAVKVQNNKYLGISLVLDYNVKITKSFFSNTDVGILTQGGNRTCIFSNNTFEKGTSEGISIWGDPVRGDDYNITIIGNSVHSKMNSSAYHLRYANTVNIVGNTADSCKNVVGAENLGTSNNISIVGNNSNSTGTGVVGYIRSSQISGNTFNNIAACGIWLGNGSNVSSDISIVGNIISNSDSSNNGNDAIRLTNTSNVSVKNNQVIDKKNTPLTYSGIRLQNGTVNAVIVNNEIGAVQNNAIIIETGASGAFLENNYGTVSDNGIATIIKSGRGLGSDTTFVNSATLVSHIRGNNIIVTGSTANVSIDSIFIDAPFHNRVITLAFGRSDYTILNTKNIKISTASWQPLLNSAITLYYNNGLWYEISRSTNNLNTGMSGGQTVIGGTGASESLTLVSTSNPTKGNIYFGASQTTAFDGVNNRVGILTGLPTHSLTLGSTGNGVSIYNTSDQTTNYERLTMLWASNQFKIGTENAGTGVSRNMVLTGNIVYLSGSLIDLGNGFSTASTTNPLIRSSYISTASSGIGSFFALSNTVNQSGSAGFRSLWISPFVQATGNGNKYLIDAGTNTAANAGGTHTSKFTVDIAGKISIATGTNASVGSATLASGTVTVSNTSVTASSKIFIQYVTGSGTLGFLQQGTITAGTSFVINSLTSAGAVNTADNSTVNWWIIN